MIKVVVFLIVAHIKGNELQIDLNVSNADIPPVNLSIEEKSINNKVRNERQSAKGFCSVEEAVDKLFFLSNTNWGGETGLIQHFKKRLTKDCSPESYYYPTISNTGIYTICYKLPEKCSGPPGKPYNEKYCATSDDLKKLLNIQISLTQERDRFVEKKVKEITEKIKRIASKHIEDKLTQQLAENPNRQLRLSIEDIYTIRSEIAKELAKHYDSYIVNIILNEIGEFLFGNIEYFAPIMSLSGTPAYIILGSLPFAEELIQCNISIKNLIIKGVLKVGTRFIFKVPVIKSIEPKDSMVYDFLKEATIAEAEKWIKHFFGDGLEVKMVNPIKEYGKDFALITVEVVLDKYSNKK